MWVFLNDAYLSIVEDKDSGDLMIRARQKGDIERVFPGLKVRETLDGDYRFRANAGRNMVARTIAKRVRQIHYTNFKNSVPIKDNERHNVYLRVWTVLAAWQDKMTPKGKKDKGKKAATHGYYDTQNKQPEIVHEIEGPWWDR